LKNVLTTIYDRLYRRYGPQYWWPAETNFEIIVGAILTQNTSWSNVEKAISNLRAQRALSYRSLSRKKTSEIASLIRPSGYYRVKAQRLKNFLTFLAGKAGGNSKRLFKLDTRSLRQALLSVNGIGPETADVIALYAAKKPVFVIDGYTRRVLSRHAVTPQDSSYDDLQRLFMEHLPVSVELFNEYHALLVRVGKEYCRSRPRCAGCPLNSVSDTRGVCS